MLTGTLLGLVSALCWSLANLSIQTSARKLGVWSALVWAQLLGAVVMALVALALEGRPRGWSSESLVLMCQCALAACVAYAGLFEALRRGQMAMVTPIISAWSAVSVAIGVLFHGASVSRVGALGMTLVIAGNVLLARSAKAGSPRDGSGTPTAALVWAALAMLGFGALVPGVDALGSRTGRIWAVPAVWAGELAVGVPALLAVRAVWGSRAHAKASASSESALTLARPRDTGDWVQVARTGVLEAGGFVAVSLALSEAPVTVVSPVSSLSTAGSVLIGLYVLREPLSRAARVGAAAACLGIVLLNI